MRYIIIFLISIIGLVRTKAQNRYLQFSCHHLDSIFLEKGEGLEIDYYFDIAQARLEICSPNYNSNSDSCRLNHLSFAAYSAYLKDEFYLSISQYKDFLKNIEKAFGTVNLFYAQDLSMLGTVYHSIGNYGAAKNCFEESITTLKALYPESPDVYAVALWIALNNAGYLFMDMAFYSEAETYLRTSLQLKSESEGSETDDYITTLNNLAIAIELQGRYEEAGQLQKELLQKSENLYGKQSPDYAIALNNAAIFYLNAGNTSLAEKLIREALKIDQSRNRIVNLGQILEEKGDLEAALNNYSRISSEIIKKGISHPEEFHILNLYANCLLKNNELSAAEDIAAKAISSNRISGIEKTAQWISAKEASKSHLILAKAAFINNIPNYEKAFEAIDKGMLVNDEIWSELVLESDILQHQENAMEHISLGLEIALKSLHSGSKTKDWPSVILNLSDKKRALLLKRDNNSTNLIVNEKSDSTLEQISKLKSLFEAEKAKFINARNESDREKHEKEILKISERITFLNQDKTLNNQTDKELGISNLMAALSDDMQILEYALSDSFLIINHLSNKHLQIYKSSISKTKLSEIVKKHLENLNNFEEIISQKKQAFSDYSETARQLFSILLEPVFEKIKDRKKLIIIPDEILCLIPFESLICSDISTDDFKDLDYLLHYFDISYHFSAALWQHDLKAPKTVKKELLAYAGHYENDNVFRPLSSAAEEIDFLSKIFKGSYLKEGDFEKHYLENAGNYNVIHMAAHGVVNKEHPILNGILLKDSPNEQFDNFLQAYEIRNIALSADLVVLSACKSGLAKILSGEGPHSLARSFYRAGASSVLVSLWQVNDKISADIMKRFYKELKSGKSKSESLRNAKLDFIKNTEGIKAHPAFWSAFVMIGKDGPVQLESRDNLFFPVSIALFILVLLPFLIFFKKSTPK